MPRPTRSLSPAKLERWAAWLTEQKARCGLSTFKLAQELNESQSRVARWCDGRRAVTAERAFEIGQALNRLGARSASGPCALYVCGFIVDLFGFLIHLGALESGGRAAIQTYCLLGRFLDWIDMEDLFVQSPTARELWADSYKRGREADPPPWFDGFDKHESLYEAAWENWLQYERRPPKLSRRLHNLATELAQRVVAQFQQSAANSHDCYRTYFSNLALEPARLFNTLLLADHFPDCPHKLAEQAEFDACLSDDDSDDSEAIEHSIDRINDSHAKWVYWHEVETSYSKVLSDAVASSEGQVLQQHWLRTMTLGRAFPLLSYIDNAKQWFGEHPRIWRLFGEWAWDVDRELFAAIRDEALPGRLVYYDAPTTADVSLASSSRAAKQVEPLTPVARSSEPTT